MSGLAVSGLSRGLAFRACRLSGLAVSGVFRAPCLSRLFRRCLLASLPLGWHLTAQRLLKQRDQQREALIKLFDPREREAVEYLRWMKNQIYSNYKKFTGSKDIPHNIQSLDQRWEDFVDLLDVYRRRKHHLRSINRQAVQNQLQQAERSVEGSRDDRERRIQQANVEILKRRVAAFNDIERSVKLVEGQLQSIENFFGLVNDQVVTLPTPERVSALDFEQLSDSIAMTKQMLEETSDTFAALDSHNRDIGNYELLLNSGSSK